MSRAIATTSSSTDSSTTPRSESPIANRRWRLDGSSVIGIAWNWSSNARATTRIVAQVLHRLHLVPGRTQVGQHPPRMLRVLPHRSPHVLLV
ncbi:MAG: hypothetical protein M3R09_00185, partial [Actinomycetota bacterium]|nr:hypothetical protein [Actinomycetota bacterium]